MAAITVVIMDITHNICCISMAVDTGRCRRDKMGCYMAAVFCSSIIMAVKACDRTSAIVVRDNDILDTGVGSINRSRPGGVMTDMTRISRGRRIVMARQDLRPDITGETGIISMTGCT